MPTEIENPINLVLLIIGTFLSLSLGFFLLFNKSAKNRANLFLGALLLVIFTYFIPRFLLRFHLLATIPYFIGVSSFMGFLVGPFAYFYIRSCTQKGFQLRQKDWLHFIPFGIDFLSDVPQLLQSNSAKIDRYLDFVSNGALYELDWVLMLKSIHGVAYFVICTRLIFQYRKELNNKTSAIDTTFHRWILFFITMLALPIIAMLFYVYSDYQRIFITFALLCFFVFILAVYLAIIIKPELFHVFPHQLLIPESSEDKKQKYESSKLQDTQKEKYIQKLQTFVAQEKPHLEPELTLAQLSEQVNIPSHYLSQVINEKLDCNFLDFINGYRVTEAKAKLVDSKLSHYTILAVAYEAGFNAKSTFYTAFKKHTGMTPSQYRKQAKIAVA